MAQTEIWSMRNQRGVPVWLGVLAAILIVSRIVVMQLPDSASEEKDSLVRWVSPDIAVNRAQKSGKPILYDFTAAWCQPCQHLNKQVFSNPEFAFQINNRFVPVRVVDRQQEDGRNSASVDVLQKKYGISAFPTLVIADAGGAEKARMQGFSGVAQFEQLLDKIKPDATRKTDGR